MSKPDLISRPRNPVKGFAAFLLIFVLLYAAAVYVAERQLRANPPDGALRMLAAYPGKTVDWLVIGASHALPLEFGEVPDRLQSETGQSMLVLGEVGAGPVISAFILDRALQDLDVRHILYLADSFAFASPAWNETRFSERKLLARMPLDRKTAGLLFARARTGDVPATAFVDYLTGFSKLNPVERFPTGAWRGAVDFDQRYRPSRHATAARIKFLYPDGAPEMQVVAKYLSLLEKMSNSADRAGASLTVLKPPVPDGFVQMLPEEVVFDIALTAIAESEEFTLLDMSGLLPEAAYYFDTDHLNRSGVDAFYARALRDVLTTDR